MTVTSNPLYSSQWHLNLIGDIQTIWSEYRGAGVHTGVFDDGVERTHEDLAANYDTSLTYTAAGDTGLPSSTTDMHGTAVAGIIAAVDNRLGGVGVAYESNVTGINYLGNLQFQGASVGLEALRYGKSFDIMNNSWGVDPVYDPVGALNVFNSAGEFSREVFEDVAATGRNGLGTIITKAAGNAANNAAEFLNQLGLEGILGNSEGDAQNSLHVITTIAATDRNGRAADYSSWGANLLVTAPAAQYTTDLSGTAGDSNNNYTSTFGGTSASTPVASGVIALMLDANENLGWRDVQNILALSAGQTGSAYTAAASGFEVGTWFSNGANNWNGGGMTYHLSYGYGMVDAYAATRMAEIWGEMNGAAKTVQNMETAIAGISGAFAVGDNATATISINVTKNIAIEHIYVTISGSHTSMGDLTMQLVSPNGDIFDLFKNELGSSDLTTQWTFGVTGARGEFSQGTWQVRVIDSATGNTGSVSSVKLEFEGSTASTDTIHHITDDFQTLAAAESARQTITDGDGGFDWLNMVAIAGNVTVSLAQNAAVSVGGTTWTTLSNGQEFEAVATGDGTDNVTGNILDNELMSGRGNDIVYADFGADTVYGGAGDDLVTGAQGADLLHGDAGNDTIYGNTAPDTIYGDDGADYISTAEGADWAYGGAGNDTLAGGTGVDNLAGDDGNDSIIGSAGADILNGNAGDDIILGGSAWDTLSGDDGNDTLYGNFGSDLVFGGAGTDLIAGGSGDDTLRGGDGNDTIYGNQGRDSIEGGAGDDLMRGGTLADRFIFNTGFGNDTIEDFEHLRDSLRIVSAVTGAATTGQQVVDTFAHVSGNDVVFDFGSGNTITLQGLTNLTDLYDNVFVI